MQSAIRIQPEGNHINVYCTYNTELVEIFNGFNGWWRPKNYCWLFPLALKERLTSTLEEKGYRVVNVPPFNTWRKTQKKEFNYSKPKQEKRVLGLCVKCNAKTMIDKDCLCEKCVC